MYAINLCEQCLASIIWVQSTKIWENFANLQLFNQKSVDGPSCQKLTSVSPTRSAPSIPRTFPLFHSRCQSSTTTTTDDSLHDTTMAIPDELQDADVLIFVFLGVIVVLLFLWATVNTLKFVLFLPFYLFLFVVRLGLRLVRFIVLLPLQLLSLVLKVPSCLASLVNMLYSVGLGTLISTTATLAAGAALTALYMSDMSSRWM